MKKWFWLLSLACATGFGTAGCGDGETYASPEECFRVTFSKYPDAAVSELKGQGKGFREWDVVYLRFTASPEELNRLLGRTFKPVTLEQFGQAEASFEGQDAPDWWRPFLGKPRVFLRSDAFRSSEETSEALVAYNPTTQVVYLCWNSSS